MYANKEHEFNHALYKQVFYFISCGGMETLSAYAGNKNDFDPCEVLTTIPPEHVEFLYGTQFYYHQDHFMFVHAGVDPKDITGEKTDNQAFLWQRQPLWKVAKGWE